MCLLSSWHPSHPLGACVRGPHPEMSSNGLSRSPGLSQDKPLVPHSRQGALEEEEVSSVQPGRPPEELLIQPPLYQESCQPMHSTAENVTVRSFRVPIWGCGRKDGTGRLFLKASVYRMGFQEAGCGVRGQAARGQGQDFSHLFVPLSPHSCC